MPACPASNRAAILVLGLCCALLLCVFLLFGLGRALGAKGRHQRAADLAAMSAAAKMRDLYPRLFEPPDSPRHLGDDEYRAIATRVALRAAARNGVRARPGDVSFPGASFAPTRVRVAVRGAVPISLGGTRRERVAVRARATAELSPDTGGSLPDSASGGGYHGPLAYRQGKPMRPDVARAFDRMAAAAHRETGIDLIVVSGYRSDAEQAKLFAAHPDPKWVAPPGRSLHRLGTELDLGPPGAYGWLVANSKRFGFIKRYAWEPWHFGYIHNAGSTSVGFGSGRGEEHHALPSFVPARFQAPIAKAAERWNVGAALLAAQIYAESGFNPFARSGAGALGIAQFMPGTARGYGLRNPFDPEAAIDAQAHLMRDLLSRFGSVPLALAAYNAGEGAVARCMCIPFAETRAYVARILGLLGGAEDMAAPTFTLRLVE